MKEKLGSETAMKEYVVLTIGNAEYGAGASLESPPREVTR